MLIGPQIFKQAEGGRKAQPVSPSVPSKYQDLCRELALACPTKAIRILP